MAKQQPAKPVPHPVLKQARKLLRAAATEANRVSGQRFFKERVRLYGVKAADTRRIAKDIFQEIKYLPKQEVFSFCEQLWQSGYMEESFIACHCSYELRKQYEPADFILFERWVESYITNWASCDTFCNHTVGTIIEMYPAFVDVLKQWTISPNRWVRRAAAVSLIVPARKGMFLPDIFDIALMLLRDKDDMVQKGYGWMLKEASKAARDEVFDFVQRQKSEMPRTALRYAIEKMPQELRRLAMEK